MSGYAKLPHSVNDALCKLPPSAVVVYVRLMRYADHNGENCHPGMERIASETGLSSRTVIRAVQHLEKTGLLTVQRDRQKDGTRAVNKYAIHVTPVSPGPCDKSDISHVTPVSQEQEPDSNKNQSRERELGEKLSEDETAEAAYIASKLRAELGNPPDSAILNKAAVLTAVGRLSKPEILEVAGLATGKQSPLTYFSRCIHKRTEKAELSWAGKFTLPESNGGRRRRRQAKTVEAEQEF